MNLETSFQIYMPVHLSYVFFTQGSEWEILNLTNISGLGEESVHVGLKGIGIRRNGRLRVVC